MELSRYEHAEILNQISGYMISKKFGETPEQFFIRAKAELISNLNSHIEKVSSFSFEDFCKKDRQIA